MFWILVAAISLAAIFFALFNTWPIAGWGLAIVVLWVGLVAGLSQLFGETGALVGLVLPFALMLALAIYGIFLGDTDSRGNPKRRSSLRKSRMLNSAEWQKTIARARERAKRLP